MSLIIIRNAEPDGFGEQFWGESGWGDITQAEVYRTHELDHIDLPLGGEYLVINHEGIRLMMDRDWR